MSTANAGPWNPRLNASRPAATLIDYTAALERELGDISAEFGRVETNDLAPVNAALKAKGKPEITLPEHAPVAWQFSGDPDAEPAERD